MKKLIYTLVTVFAVQIGVLQAQSARLQVIHNAADNNASVVDIYLKNGSADSVVVKLENFAFRDATPFVSVPAGDSLAVIIAGPDSDNEGDQMVATIPLGALAENETYAAIANGVLNSENFASNPDGREIGFELLIRSGLRETGQSSNVDFVALHGATDAPTVDIVARNVTTLVNDAAYTDITEYVDVPPASYTLDVTPGADNSTIVASFDADLSGLGGGSAIVFASGFLTPADNQFGPAFGIFAALANGDVVEFPAVSKARLQVIHNSADVAADPVDIYLRNGSADSLLIKLNDFAFRTATPFVDVPADDSLSVIVALSTSSGEDNGVITTIPLGGLKNGETYVALASGVVDSSLYSSNPDNIDINFEILVTAGAREMSETENVEFIAVHGATDAPTVKISARDVAELVPAAAYRDITDYIGVPAGMYTLDVSVQSDITNTPVASFMADLSGLGGGSAVVFASGFLSPASNQNGEGFGLFAALANGDVVPFPSVSKARLQVIHNAADIAADPVDIYLKNGTADSVVIKLDNFTFRSATPFVDVPAGDSLAVIVAGPGSADENSEVVAVIPIGALQKDEKYVAIANGLVTPNEYAPNPDGRETAFELLN